MGEIFNPARSNGPKANRAECEVSGLYPEVTRVFVHDFENNTVEDVPVRALVTGEGIDAVTVFERVG